MLSSDIKPLKAGLQEKTQSSLILCVTWHLFGAAFLLHGVCRGIQIGESLAGLFKSKWLREEDPLAVIQSTPDPPGSGGWQQTAALEPFSGVHGDANSHVLTQLTHLVGETGTNGRH